MHLRDTYTHNTNIQKNTGARNTDKRIPEK